MEVLALAGAWLINNINPQKVLQSVGLVSVLTSQSVIIQDLTPVLSSNASILVRGSPNFEEATARWSLYNPPTFDTVINVMTEQDVQEAVHYANRAGRPFLVRAGGHGSINSLANLQDGIQIDLRGLQKVEIAADGRSATIGGGTLVKKVIDTLWASKKQAVTGICECVSVIGPLLGGGHGFLQGEYGLLADQLIQARVVLSNGTAVTVSAASHPDLFWALKGAGHNFGVVTEFKYKIYDVPGDGMWAFEFFWFTQNRLEDVYELTNKMMLDQPPHMAQWTFAHSDPEIDPDHCSLMYMVVYQGSQEDARAYTAPIHNLGPARVASGQVPYTALPGLMQQSEDGLACAKGLSFIRFPFHTNTYHVPSLRKGFDEFDRMVREYPGLNNSHFLIEGYSTHAVKEVKSDSTAFPHRRDEIIMALYLICLPDPELHRAAEEYGKRIRSYVIAGTDNPEQLHAYVNYAHGDEKPEDMYGWEPWRMDKLRRLKKEYDPINAFRWYAPIEKD